MSGSAASRSGPAAASAFGISPVRCAVGCSRWLVCAPDDLDPVVVRVSHERQPRASFADLVRRTLRLDALLREALERSVQVLDADRDVAVAGALLVGSTVVVVGQLEDGGLVAHREEVVGRFL